MKNNGSTILKNTSALMSTQLFTWALTYALMLFIPRYLGAEGVGKLHFASATWVMAAVIFNFGTDVLLKKEIGRKPATMGHLLGGALVAQTLFFAIGSLGVMGLLVYFAYPPSTIAVAGIIGLGTLFNNYVAIYSAILFGLEQMRELSLIRVISTVVYGLLAVATLVFDWGIYVLAGLEVFAALLNLILVIRLLHRQYRPRIEIAWRNTFQLLQRSFPYLFSSVFLIVYMQIDIVIISALVDERAVGLYSAADRLFGTLLFLPSIYLAAVFPAFSRLFVEDSVALHRLMAKSFDTLLLIGIPIGLGLILIADPLTLLIYGADFAQSGPILAVFGIVLILTYQNILLGQFLISIDRQNTWTIVMAIATIATIPLDLFLVPWCETLWENSSLGGALAFVITELGILSAGIVLLPKGILNADNLWVAARIVGAGLLMVILVWPLRHFMIAIPILSGAAAYIIMILALRVIPNEDFRHFYALIGAFQLRLRRAKTEAISH